MASATRIVIAGMAWAVVAQSAAQSIDTVLVTELGRYQHPYVQFPDSFSAPVLSSRIDRLGRPYVYLACSDSGLFVWDITLPTAPVVVKRLPTGLFSDLSVSSLEQEGSLLYLALGALDSGTPGLAVLDVSDAADPMLLDHYAHTPFSHGAAIVKVHGGFAYVGAMADGLMVVDASDPQNLQLHATYLPDPSWPGIASYAPNARGMAIVDTLLYLAFDAGGLRVLSIADPSAPYQIAQYLNPQHPALTNPAYNNVVAKDDRLFVAIDYCGLEVVDITDPAAPQQVEWLNPWSCFGLNWFGSDGHANEVVLARNDSLLLMSAGDSEVLVYDVTDSDAPELRGGHIVPNDTAAAWGVDGFGDLIVAGYINNHGLPFQPFDSKFGGALLFNMQVDLITKVPHGALPDGAVVIWPQPAGDVLHVQWAGGHSVSSTAGLFDAQGRAVAAARVQSGDRWSFDVASLSSGCYLLRIGSDHAVRMQPVLITH